MAITGPYEIVHYYFCLSTDTKPTASVGDRLYETNTKLWYICTDGSTWSALPSDNESTYTVTNPAVSAAVTTAILDAYGTVIITLTAAGNAQTLQSPTITTAGKLFTVVNNDTSNNTIVVNGITIPIGKAQTWIWDGTAWVEVDLGITSLPVPINQGGTGQTTAATAFDALKQTATDAYVGVVELANDTEAVAGTADRAITPANLIAKLAAPGAIGGTTPAAGTFTTLDTTGDANIGTTAAGKNLTVNATRGAELITWTDAGWNEDGSTWTFAGGVLTHVTGNTTAVTATLTAAIEVGKTYEVTIVGTGGGATATYTLGSVTGTTIAASGAIAITDYITATTTGSLIITPANTNTVAITSISIKAFTDATGDLTVDGNIVARSPFLAGRGYYASPVYSFAAYPTTGYVFDGSTHRLITSGSNALTLIDGTLTISPNVSLCRDADYTLALRTGSNQQIARFYNTYTNSSNYERLSLTGVQGSSVNISAETAGTGGDNLDVVLTPAGTGAVKTGNVQPITDDTYYLGKNDDDTPLAYKGIILKDTTNGKYYRIEIISGSITATDLTD